MAAWKETKEKLDEEKKIPKEVNWVPLSEAYKRRSAMKIGIWGPEGCGKTHFALTCPEPVYIVDTELGAPQLFLKFPHRKIIHLDCLVLNEETEDVDTIESLKLVEQAIKSLKDVNEGTVIIDSGTDIWSWIGDWNELKHDHLRKSGKFYQFHWGPANRRYRVLVWNMLKKEKVNVVMTAHAKDVYDSQGKIVQGLTKAGWMKKSGHWFDFVIEIQKRTDKIKGISTFQGKINKCRYEMRGISGMRIEDITFDKLYKIYQEIVSKYVGKGTNREGVS